MEFVVTGEDEHGLPLLEVNMYPVVVGMSSDNLVFGVDGRHLVAGLTIPLEDTGLSTTDLDSLPLHGGWATISTAHGEGLRPQDLEGTFGPRSAVVVLEALADALLSESINADMRGLRTDRWNCMTTTGMRRFLPCTRICRAASKWKNKCR